MYCAEVKEEALALASAASGLALEIRRLVTSEHGAALSGVYLLKPRSIPKTTSGKIAR